MPHPARPYGEQVLSFEQARALVEQHAASLRSLTVEAVPLASASGRILAEDILADRDFPPFPRVTRDGYALRAADLNALPARLRVVAEIKAGASDGNGITIEAGQAAVIMTGAPAPSGADAVVMVEYSTREGEFVEIRQAVASGDNIVPTGSEAKRGSSLLKSGHLLNPAAAAVAASVGKASLNVFARPRIAILATGDEIVDIAATPGPTQIRNSNSHSLAAQVRNAGGEPVLLPVAPDEKTRLRALIEEGLRYDLLLLSGGVSMGEYDLVEQVLSELGTEFFFTGARIQPGKPVVFGRVRGKYFYGLPGNPVSTMVTFELFVRTALDALRGAGPSKLRFLHARLKSPIKTRTGLTRFLPALLTGDLARAEVEKLPWQGSGDIATTAQANCYVVIPPDRETIAAGEWVAILPC